MASAFAPQITCLFSHRLKVPFDDPGDVSDGVCVVGISWYLVARQGAANLESERSGTELPLLGQKCIPLCKFLSDSMAWNPQQLASGLELISNKKLK